MKKCILVIFAMFFVGCSTTGVHLAGLDKLNSNSSDNTTERKLDDSLRSQIAKIDKIRFLYATNPVDYINISSKDSLILTDEYWFSRVNEKLHDICENNGGKTIGTRTIKDSFTGEITQQSFRAGYGTRKWHCSGGSMNFTVEAIETNQYSNASFGEQQGALDSSKKLWVKVISSLNQKPIISNHQYNSFVKYKDYSLEEFLNSRFGVFGGKARTKVKMRPDGSYFQEYTYEPDDVTNISQDLGVIYDLHAYCGLNGGYLKPLTKFDFKNLFPYGVTFQCTSDNNPFYFKTESDEVDESSKDTSEFIKEITATSRFRYTIIVREGVLPDTTATNMATGKNNTQEPQSAQGLEAMLAEKIGQKITAVDDTATQIINAVNHTTPHAVMDNPNYVLNIYWIRQNGNCENISIVKTYKYSKDTTDIQNYLRCNGQVKKLRNTNLPVRLPDNLRESQDAFFRQIRKTGSFVYVDSYSGITVIGRKEADFCKSYLFYLKDNQLLKVVEGGC